MFWKYVVYWFDSTTVDAFFWQIQRCFNLLLTAFREKRLCVIRFEEEELDDTTVQESFGMRGLYAKGAPRNIMLSVFSLSICLFAQKLRSGMFTIKQKT